MSGISARRKKEEESGAFLRNRGVMERRRNAAQSPRDSGWFIIAFGPMGEAVEAITTAERLYVTNPDYQLIVPTLISKRGN